MIGADLSCRRAQLGDGQSVLELGCGWGSMSLYMAARYPKSKITAVSNSKTQKELIDSRAKERGLDNLVSSHLLHAPVCTECRRRYLHDAAFVLDQLEEGWDAQTRTGEIDMSGPSFA